MKKLKLTIEKTCNNNWLVSDNINEYGLGTTIKDALIDYAENITSYYKDLTERHLALTTKTSKDKQILDGYFKGGV